MEDEDDDDDGDGEDVSSAHYIYIAYLYKQSICHSNVRPISAKTSAKTQ